MIWNHVAGGDAYYETGVAHSASDVADEDETPTQGGLSLRAQARPASRATQAD